MDLDERIRRRRSQGDVPQLVRDYDALSPVTHLDEPAGRGPVFEQLLDHLDPVFDGELPPNGYLYGPFGSGKSAVCSSLFAHLSQFATKTRSMIHTSTRQRSSQLPYFVDVDLRAASGRFAFYHHILDSLTSESIPEHGISTDELRERLHEHLEQSGVGGVVLVDHVGESTTIDSSSLVDLLAGLPSNMSWLGVSRRPPDEMPLTEYTATSIQIESYQKQMLVDVLMTRASKGLSEQQFSYERARQIADWAAGNAHHALAALFIAADRVNRDGRRQIAATDVTDAIEGIPDSSISLARVLSLPPNKQAVLRELVDLNLSDRNSVSETTDSISNAQRVDLTQGTIKRFLYELSECGILERVESSGQERKGRPPSRLEIQFPAAAFRRLYDLRNSEEARSATPQ
jgi:Cdc6-like AAA superfamily ATPase